MTSRNVVLVGAGTRGRVWGEAVVAHSRWDLAAIVDVNIEVARRVAALAELRAGDCFPTLDDALHGVSHVGAVIIATPHDRHVDACRDALAQHIAILVEKPFAPTVAEAVEVVRQAEQSGVPVVVGQNYRYLRSIRAARSLINAGTLGRVGMISMQYYRPWNDLEPSLREMDNAILWGMAPHHLDTVRYLTGSPIEWICAHMSTVFDDHPRVGASMHAISRLEDGTQITYAATYEATAQDRFEGGREFYMRITGSAASLHVFHRWLFLAKPGAIPRLVRRGPRDITEEAVLLSQLHDAVTAGIEAECSATENLPTVAALEACMRSAGNDAAPIKPADLLRAALGN